MMELTTLASIALIVIACAGIVISVAFIFLVKALVQNTESLRTLVGHLDQNINTAMDSVHKSIQDVKVITDRISRQMDRVESIVDNIDGATRDARHSVHMVNTTVVPMLANVHGIMAGIRKGVDTWKTSVAEEVYEPEQPAGH